MALLCATRRIWKPLTRKAWVLQQKLLPAKPSAERDSDMDDDVIMKVPTTDKADLMYAKNGARKGLWTLNTSDSPQVYFFRNKANEGLKHSATRR